MKSMTQRAFLPITLSLVALLAIGCFSDRKSSGKASYKQRQVAADIKGPQKEFQRSVVRMADLKEQIKVHHTIYERTRHSSDIIKAAEAEEASKFGLAAVSNLEELCESTLSQPSINDVSGDPQETIQTYLRFAKDMRKKFGG